MLVGQDLTPVHISDMVKAKDNLRKVFPPTPLVSLEPLNQKLGYSVHLKAESLLPSGAYKFRGATNKILSLVDKYGTDIEIITAAVSEILELAVCSLSEESVEKAKLVEPLEQVIDRLKRVIKNGHISRLRQGDCTMELGFILSDLLTNYERISDHCSNIAVCFIELENDSFETHEYLNQVKNGEKEFERMYESYKEKYYIEG